MAAPLLTYQPQGDGRPPAELDYQPGCPFRQVTVPATGDQIGLVAWRRGVTTLLRRGRMADVPVTAWVLRHRLDTNRMDGPGHQQIRALTDPIVGMGSDKFHLAELTRLATALAAGLDFADGPVDLITAYCEPLMRAAATGAMGLPPCDWDFLAGRAGMSFALLHNLSEQQEPIGKVLEEIYDYAHKVTEGARLNPGRGVISRANTVLRMHDVDEEQILHFNATLATGVPTAFAALIVALHVVLMTPGLARRFARNPRQRRSILGGLFTGRVNFATAHPRVLSEAIDFGDGLVLPADVPLLPGVLAALHHGGGWQLAFGEGPHRCPDLRDAVEWMLIALGVLTTVRPRLRLARKPAWTEPALLPPPDALMAIEDT